MNTCYWFIILREIPPSSVSGKLPSVRRSTVPGFVAAVGEPEGEGNREPVMQELVASVEKMKVTQKKGKEDTRDQQLQSLAIQSSAASTPKQPTPKRKKVVEQLSRSIEKLKMDTAGIAKSKADRLHADHLYAKADTGKPDHGKKKIKRKLFEPSIMGGSRKADMPPSAQELTVSERTIIQNTFDGIMDMCQQKKSTLFDKDSERLRKDSHVISASVSELQKHIPFLFCLLHVLIGEVSGCKEATIATIYGIIMHSMNVNASAIQRLWSTALIKCHADNKLFSRLNKVHICLSSASKQTLIQEFADRSEKRIVEKLEEKHDGKINGDNLDLRVSTNDIRMNNKTKDYHFFASDWTPFRITKTDMKENPAIQEILQSKKNVTCEVPLNSFQPNSSELQTYRSSLAVLLGRMLSESVEAFKWMGQVIPSHIAHPLSDIMARPSTSFELPIVLKNEAKYEDCIGIMDSYVVTMRDLYKKAGRG